MESIYDLNQRLLNANSSLYGPKPTSPSPAGMSFGTPNLSTNQSNQSFNPPNFQPATGPAIYVPPPIRPQPANIPAPIAPVPISPTVPVVPPAPVIKAPDDPSNKYNTATGALNPNYAGYSAPAITPITAPVAPGSVADISRSFYEEPINPDQAEIDRLRGIVGGTYQETDPNVIYQKMLLDQQARIDAINNVYNDQLAQARLRGQGRLGTSIARQARGGLLGSSFGTAMTNVQEAANVEEQKAIENQRMLDVQSVYSKISADAREEAAANRLAKSKGAEAMLEFYNVTKPALRAKRAKNAIAGLIQKGVDITTLTPDELNSFTSGLGMTKDEFVTSFNEAQTTATTEREKAAAEKAKAEAELGYKTAQTAASEASAAKNLAEAGQVGKMTPYQSAQIAIDWYKAKNPSKSASDTKLNAIGGIATLFSPSEINPDGTKTNVVPGTDGIPYVDDNGYVTPEGWKTVMREAAGDNITKKDLLEQFGGLIAPGLESRYGLTPADIKIIQGALPTAE